MTEYDIAHSVTAIMENKLELKENEEITVTVGKKKRSKLPPFVAVGNGNCTQDFKADVVMDAFCIVGALSPKQLEIFLYFKDEVVRKNMNAHFSSINDIEVNHIYLSQSDDNSKKIKKLLGENKNAQDMIDKKIFKKISASKYMVNPYLIIPMKNFDDVVKKWDELE